MIFSIVNDQNPHLRFYLGRYLKQKREGQNLAVKSMAEQLQFSEREYRGVETGKTKLTIEIFENLVQILALDQIELSEIKRISNIAHANSITRELSENYPR